MIPLQKRRNFANSYKLYVVALFQMMIFLLAWLASILLYSVSLSVPVAEQLQPFQDVMTDEVDMSDFGKFNCCRCFASLFVGLPDFPCFIWSNNSCWLVSVLRTNDFCTKISILNNSSYSNEDGHLIRPCNKRLILVRSFSLREISLPLQLFRESENELVARILRFHKSL